MWYELAGVPALLMLMLLITARAARRFEARERKLGRWDQYGPLEETDAPADALVPRLDQSHGKVLRRRP